MCHVQERHRALSRFRRYARLTPLVKGTLARVSSVLLAGYQISAEERSTMDYPGHNAVTEDLTWRTAAPWIGSPVEVITVVFIFCFVVYAVYQALI